MTRLKQVRVRSWSNRLYCEALEYRFALDCAFAEFIDPNPNPGNQFGKTVLPLSTGNVVITAPYDDAGGVDAGAVYLFDGGTGDLISTLTGSTAGDKIGIDGVIPLTNGNFLVRSKSWHNGVADNAGAVTFGDGNTGIDGVVSSLNSLVGATVNDQVGTYLRPLANGNYVIGSLFWDHDSVIDAGAFTFGNGETGIAGEVSSSNSLVGSTQNDRVGGIVTLLNGSRYVIGSPTWDNGSAADAGAVTFGDGVNGVTGVVSSLNSLVGSSSGDRVGNRVTHLPDGSYVVMSEYWDNGTIADAGAATYGNGATGVVGEISATNSLVGTQADDRVGRIVTPLPNGSYVISSQYWNNGSVTAAGAVTFGVVGFGVTGAVTSVNSLVGSSANDQVGGGSGIVVLSNGNYVVRSSLWDNGSAIDAGAVTFGSGVTGISGTVASSNSLVGSSSGDKVGNTGIVALSNGNYVVRSESWSNGGSADAGAVTFGNGMTGVAGVVSSANSLVGSTPGDQVGYVTELANGNYVVASDFWDNGNAVDAGAVTFGNGTTGVTGTVSAANSLVGSKTSDQVGRYGVTVLPNGNYVVKSPNWNNGTALNAGAVTFASGTSGITGEVSATNSLVGTTADDDVGYGGVTVLANGNYVVRSFGWDNGPAMNAGAVTFGDSEIGVSGEVSAANSLVGTAASNGIGGNGIKTLTNGNYLVMSPLWDNGDAINAGAVTFGNGAIGISGEVSPANSLVGSTTGDQVSNVIELTNGNYVVLSSLWDNGDAENAGAVTFGDGTTGVVGVVSRDNSLVGTRHNDSVGFHVTPLFNGNYVVVSRNWNNGDIIDAGAITFANGESGITGEVSVANSLVGTTSGDRIGIGGIARFANGNYAIQSYTWDNGSAVDAGAVTFGNGQTGVVGLIDESNSMIGESATTNLQQIVVEYVNGCFFGRFLAEDGGRVRVGSLETGVFQNTIVDRLLLYQSSPLSNESIASTTALFAGEMSSKNNYTNHPLGITGLLIDLALEPDATITPADFTFRTGRTDDTTTWNSVPIDPTITIRPGEGTSGSDRIVLTWPDGTITNTWLEVTVKANANTGLAEDDVFYFGNQIGDTNGDGLTNASDFAAIRANQTSFLNPADVDNAFDINKDGLVNATDLLIVRDHFTPIANGLPMITPSGPALLKTSESSDVLIVLEERPKQASHGLPVRETSDTVELDTALIASTDAAILAEYGSSTESTTADDLLTDENQGDELPLDLIASGQ